MRRQLRLARRREVSYGLLVTVARAMTGRGAGEVRWILAAAGIRSTTAQAVRARAGLRLARRGRFPVQVLVFPEDAQAARCVLRAHTVPAGDRPLPGPGSAG